MKPLIKWPGGKRSELGMIRDHMPQFDHRRARFVSPFLGGGAVFFDIVPEHAYLNDIDDQLIGFYECVRREDPDFHSELESILQDWRVLTSLSSELVSFYTSAYKCGEGEEWYSRIDQITKEGHYDTMSHIVGDKLHTFLDSLEKYIVRKLRMTRKLEEKSVLYPDTHQLNFETALKSAYYTLIRDSYYNKKVGERGVFSAYFFFVREFCFGSMFRFNSEGHFNIPYGGIHYNRKNFASKVSRLKSPEVLHLLQGDVTLFNMDFMDFFQQVGDSISRDDFIFVDPPYDSDFSKYGNRGFDHDRHLELAEVLSSINGRVMLVIKKTEFIESLYKEQPHLTTVPFEKAYTYNMRGRNKRDTTHLIVKNY